MTYQPLLIKPRTQSFDITLPADIEDLAQLLSEDLDFHHSDSGYASHSFHSFPAKFPPQLPRKFIHALTRPGDVVLDPMMGSGTTLVEASLAGRVGIGCDIDPLAVKITYVKTQMLNAQRVMDLGREITDGARYQIDHHAPALQQRLARFWDAKTQDFADYWFLPQIQLELLALFEQIQQIDRLPYRAFFELIFSSTIITKSGGVSLALDLAHTRPHRAKIVKNRKGDVLIGDVDEQDLGRRAAYLTKTQRSPLREFKKRLKDTVKHWAAFQKMQTAPYLCFSNAQTMALRDNTVDLVVTSPPYASNAIDYMRAHKFSLIWFGHAIDDLGDKRSEYIGGESISAFHFEPLPLRTQAIVDDIARLDAKKGQVLHRYYSEITRVLREVFRVLKPGKSAIFVVGSSVMRGRDTETHHCLAEIGAGIGFEVPEIGVRHLDRNRRMMPAGTRIDRNSQIQQRMHEEYVLGFYKPTGYTGDIDAAS